METFAESKALSATQRLAYLLFVVLLASSLCFSHPAVSSDGLAAPAGNVATLE